MLGLVPVEPMEGAVMSQDELRASPGGEARAVDALPTAIDGLGAAGFIYFDNVTNSGAANGIVNITLTACRYIARLDGTVAGDNVVVAYLRCSLGAAVELQRAVNNALLLAAPVEGKGDAN